MSLYLDHFGLREPPYRITPHTEFFYDGANRGATLDALIYAVVHDEGIVKVTGEVGSGKTMLCRMLLEKLPASVETIYFSNPSLNRDELLLALADELNMPAPPAVAHQLLRAVQQHLISLHLSGKQVVVLIDEAHAMPEESLEEIRLLSNLETQRAKLLQIVLFGQPELNLVLGTPQMRQLRERVTHNFSLEPLKQTDVGTYLNFRLRAAGYRGPDIFAPAAIKRFAEVSHGLTRRLNILADKALLAAFAANTHLIDGAIANIAVTDAQFDDTGVAGGKSARKVRPLLAAGIAAIAGVLLVAGWLLGRNDSTGAAAADTSVAAPARIQTPAPPPQPAAETTGTGPATPAATTPPTAAAAPPTAGSPAATSAGAASSGVAAEKLQIIAPPEDASKSGAGQASLLKERRLAFERWIDGADARHYTAQMLRIQAHHTGQAEDFLRRAIAIAAPADFYAYEASADGQRWIGVVYGEFTSVAEAERMLAALPESLRNNQPFIRTLRHLKP